MTDREHEMQVDRDMQDSYTQSQNLKRLVEKMLKVVKADTGGSRVYADMLLSMLPNSTHKVNMSYWCYKADRDDFQAILEFLPKFRHSDLIWKYEEYVLPNVKFLKKYLGVK